MLTDNKKRIERRGAVARLLRDRSPDLLVVAGLGSAIWDVESAGETPLNFYLLGAMGSVVPTALGLAAAQPHKKVVAFTGDSELGMGLYALATVGWRKPANLSIVCLDNGRFGETGGQISHTGVNLDLAGVARAAGISVVKQVSDEAEVDGLRDIILNGEGPAFIHVLVTADMPPVKMPIRSGHIGLARFREALLGPDALKE
jgi:thiamine pyrophosphate-dependent acetolactate synthase large subunit-like protein